MAPKKDKSLERLRELLFGPEYNLQRMKADIERLKKQLADKEAIIATLDPVITDLLSRKISNNREDMAETLAPVMSEAIKRQVDETREELVDALYPIIGRTIRKSVAEAMKDQFASVNKKIADGIRRSFLPAWIQGKILGVPKAQLFVKSAMPFRIEQIFLIHSESGILIAHVTPETAGGGVDQEIISGMLTAIRDFVAQAFEAHEGELREIQYGESKIILDIGRYVYLAVVVSGYEPDNFYNEVSRLNQRIYNRFYKTLRQFEGETNTLQPVNSLLQAFIHRFNMSETIAEGKPSKPYLLYLLRAIVILIGLIMAAILLPDYFSGYQTRRAVQQQLQSVPMIDTREIRYTVKDDRVILTGTVNSFAQKATLDSLIKTLPQVKSVDNRLQVLVPAITADQLETELKRRLALYDSINYFQPRIIVAQDHVVLNGFVPDSKMKHDIGRMVSEIAGVRLVTNNLIVLNDRELTEVRGFLRDHSLSFPSFSVELDKTQIPKIDAVVMVWQALKDARATLVVRGYSDDTKDFYENLRLSKLRAQKVKEELERRGISPESMILLSYGERYPKFADERKPIAVHNSRVEFDVLLGR